MQSTGMSEDKSSPAAPIVVMKFGGTSVQDAVAITRSIDIVRERRERGFSPVVVVSAMSGVTNQLLDAAKSAVNNDLAKAIRIAGQLKERHLEAAAELVGRKIVLVIHLLDELFGKLENILSGVHAVGELTARTNDLIASFGERCSSIIVAETLEHRGLSSAHVDARSCIVTDEQFGNASPLLAETRVETREHVLSVVEAKAIPILGGFIASAQDGRTTTLGRGGSDYSAALIGSALDAAAIEIWTDVNGILTTDPRICPDALRLRKVSFDEASELAQFGAKVLHPATIRPAVESGIPVWVLNSHQPDNEGTEITATTAACSSPLKSIAVKKGLTIVHFVAKTIQSSLSFSLAVLEAFRQARCTIDVVAMSEGSISVATECVARIDQVVHTLLPLADAATEPGKALVCLVGQDIRGQKGLAAQVFRTVADVNVEMISQGANGIAMSFVIDQLHVAPSVRALHRQFFMDADPAFFDTGRSSASL